MINKKVPALKSSGDFYEYPFLLGHGILQGPVISHNNIDIRFRSRIELIDHLRTAIDAEQTLEIFQGIQRGAVVYQLGHTRLVIRTANGHDIKPLGF
jgi:hypothetical protein